MPHPPRWTNPFHLSKYVVSTQHAGSCNCPAGRPFFAIKPVELVFLIQKIETERESKPLSLMSTWITHMLRCGL